MRLTVAVVTVVSDSVPDQIVIDARSKTLTSDEHPAGGHGVIVGWPDARLHTLNEEHGYVDVSGMDEHPLLGDRLQVIPNHACGFINLHDGVLAVRDGVVERVVLAAARGLVGSGFSRARTVGARRAASCNTPCSRCC